MSDMPRINHQIIGTFRVEPSGLIIDIRVGVEQAASISAAYRTDDDISKAIDAACSALSARLKMELVNADY